MTRTEQILQLAIFDGSASNNISYSSADRAAHKRYSHYNGAEEHAFINGVEHENTRLAPLISALAEENEKLRAALELVSDIHAASNPGPAHISVFSVAQGALSDSKLDELLKEMGK